jgi:hypothetical protein
MVFNMPNRNHYAIIHEDTWAIIVTIPPAPEYPGGHDDGGIVYE